LEVLVKTIVFDLDGVLVDFIGGFTQLAAEFGYLKETYNTYEQPSWDFDWCMSSEAQDKVWEQVGKIPGWWANLPSLQYVSIFNSINELSKFNRVYFMTNRNVGNPDPLVQSYDWLKVQVTGDKGRVAKGIGADYHIDDRTSNANDIPESCKSYLIDRKYNRDGAHPRVQRVKYVEDFLTDILRDEGVVE
jgi:hypothetical protein